MKTKQRRNITVADAWYSRVNEHGDIICGAVTASFNGRPLAQAIGPNFFRGREVLFVKGFDDRPYELEVATGKMTPVERGHQAGGFAAGNGRWIATGEGRIWVACSREGELAWIVEHNNDNNNRSLLYEGDTIVANQPIAVCRIERGAMTWTIVGRGQKRHEIWGQLIPGADLRRFWSTDIDELYSVPVWTPHGWMVLIQTNIDLRLVWWNDNKVGKIIATGENFNIWPDACWVPEKQHVSVVCNGPQGQPCRYTVSLSEFRVINDGPVEPPPPPDKTMELPKQIYDTYKAVAEKFADLHRGSDADRKEANKRGVQTIRARHKNGNGELNGRRYVCKSEHNTGWNDASKDAVGFVSGPLEQINSGRMMDMHMFDMINGGTRTMHGHPIRSHNFEDDPPNPSAYALVPEDKDWLKDGEEPEEPGGVKPGQKHAYVRDDNERNECDVRFTDGVQCNEPREAEIHQVEEPEEPEEPQKPTDPTVVAQLQALNVTATEILKLLRGVFKG